MADKYNSRYTGQQIDQALEKANGIDQSIQDALGSFAVPTNQIVNGAVTSTKIANNAVGLNQLAVGCGEQRVLLWENDNPDGNFPAQTIPISGLSQYDCIEIEIAAYYNANKDQVWGGIFQRFRYLNKATGYLSYNYSGISGAGSTPSLYLYSRQFTFRGDSIDWESCFYISGNKGSSLGNVTENANLTKPMRVYGIKFN